MPAQLERNSREVKFGLSGAPNKLSTCKMTKCTAGKLWEIGHMAMKTWHNYVNTKFLNPLVAHFS